MNKQVFTAIFLFICIGLQAQTRAMNKNNYIDQWKEVAKFENDDLPQSAADKTESILKQAIADKNTQQAIKALVCINKYKIAINDDNKLNIFPDLENLLSNTVNTNEKALLHSMVGELYIKYYNQNRWTIDRRTQLTDYIPEDMQEWSGNIFLNKAIGHLNEAVESDVTLLSESTEKYNEIIIIGKDSKEYYPTLFDFLIERNIDLLSNLRTNDFEKDLKSKNLSIKEISADAGNFIKLNLTKPETINDLPVLFFYKRYFTSLLNRNMMPTIVLTELSKDTYLKDAAYEYRNEYSLNTLLNLYDIYKNNEVSTEIVDAISDRYQNLGYESGIDYGNTVNSSEARNLTKAYEWLQKGLAQYPNYKRINILKSRLANLEMPYANITGDNTFYPKAKDQKLKIEYKNLNKLTVKVFKEYSKGKEVAYEPVREYPIDLNSKTTYLKETKEISLDLDKSGKYKLELVFDKKADSDNNNDPVIYVTGLFPFARITGPNDYEFYIVDRMSGTPVKDAVISIEKDSIVISQITTDGKGFAQYKSDTNLNSDYSIRSQYKYSVSTNNDKANIKLDFPYNYQFRSDIAKQKDLNTTNERVNIFIDRNIYRPGQTLYYKAIISSVSNKQESLVTNQSYKVELYNRNGQLVSDQTVKTNEFGSVSGEFILPKGGITGNFYLKINNQSMYFSVEEYKRPTFQITFDKITQTYAFGDKITLTGHAEGYSGAKLQNADVNYYITKSSLWRWMGNTETIESGATVTKEDGSFEISFIIPKNDSKAVPLWKNAFSFNVSASITDINGETQDGNYSFNVGSVSMMLNTNIADKFDKKSKDAIEIKATNLDGQELTAKNGSYFLYSIQENDTTRKEILRGEFASGKQALLTDKLIKQTSGKYILKLRAKDDGGRDVESENEFILYSVDDKRPPITTNEWYIVKSSTFNQGKNAEIVLGVSAKNVTVLYELSKDKQTLERTQVKLSNENKTFVIPYKESYEDGVYASFTYVLNEKIYQNVYNISKEKEEKSLKLKFEVFRDKLRPGQQEEWKISVKDNRDKPAYAELLASMYDSSLDKLRQSQAWVLNAATGYTEYPVLLRSGLTNNNLYSYLRFVDTTTNTDYPVLDFDYINWFGFAFNSYNIRLRGGSVLPVPAPSSPDRGELEDEVSHLRLLSKNALQETVVVGYGTMKKSDLTGAVASVSQDAASGGSVEQQLAEEAGVESQPQVRKNFNETAFFFPKLKTDANGETLISFTVPESNTIWKFRALAHDKNLNTGTLEALTVSRKELMVTPNIPRFMRQGDKTSISTKISNLSENAISGNVRIEFFNPVNDEAIALTVNNQSQTFSVAKDGSTSAAWTFDVPSDIEMIGCRIVAQSETFSDGEQHAISVLPNRMLVTESMTMNVNSGQDKNFTFKKLAESNSNTLSNYRLTLEYASNPAWYAVQALPTLSNPANENAVNWFASYYVNTLGASFTTQYPKVSAMINIWKQQGESKESLVSNLMENEELKSVLLEETPWVLDAKDETEQMQRLSLLFDLNNTNQKTTEAISKLQELQNADGGWSWFKGFSASRSITQYILYGFTQLIHLNAVQYPENVKVMQMSAIRYIDEQIRKDFESLKKNNKDWEKITGISTNQLEYLYVRSSYRDIPINQETRAAERFYTSVVEKNWTKLNLYQRSLLAVVTQRNGNKDLSAKIMKSISERSTVNDEMGMFWANNRSNVFMSQSAVSVHVFIMDAFKETKASDKNMDLMKQWLLKQKQTQKWESTHATVDAIYALLSTGSNWFESNQTAKIKVGNKPVQADNKEAGTGYFKKTWDKAEISKDMAKVEVSSTGNTPSYGALYWQYYEDLDRITSQKGELNIEKKLFVESTSDKGKALNQVSESNPLKVGDKVIVRLTVKVDRDMEFVHLKDMRASCFEPADVLSGNRWQNSVIYYQSTKDASTNFYFDNLPKGTYVFEYPVLVNRTGEYSNGITSIQCLYAPEFVSHTAGLKITVKE